MTKIPSYNEVTFMVTAELAEANKGKPISIGGISFGMNPLPKNIRIHKKSIEKKIAGKILIETVKEEVDKKDREYLKSLFKEFDGELIIIGTKEQARNYAGLIAYIKENKLIMF